MKNKLLLFVLLLLFTGTGFLAAQTAETAAANPAGGEEEELYVNADSMEMKVDDHIIELDGNVVIEDKSMRLTAKKMVIYLDKDNRMRNIEAVGGVTVRKLETSESATGDSGFYDAELEKVTLRGNCVILQGKNTATGDAVVYDRKVGTIKLQGAQITIPMKKGGLNSPFGKKEKTGNNGENENPQK